MKMQLKEMDEQGEVHITGTLNQIEMQYLIQFAVNSLMAMGAEFVQDEGAEDDSLRIKLPDGTVVH